ncbi:MAG: serine hydrolase [Candidatus Aminicenantes bacterium]|nr:serine hydrolase [Candidatus Aminicenantes bacterium]
MKKIKEERNISHRHSFRKFPALTCLLLCLLFFVPGCGGSRDDYWPTTDWKVSTPEEQGIDSEKLIAMFQAIEKKGIEYHSILIVRGGFLVLEAYFSPFKKNYKHINYSATKSMSSLLIGMAVADGDIQNIQQPLLLDFFPAYKNQIENLDERKKSLTLFHLLTMTDGLEWQDWPYRVGREGDFLKLLGAEDGVKYYLNKPVRNVPGKTFNYNSGSSYMLAAIIQQTTGKSALEYAREKLFTPIGISDACWGVFQDGINNGASELYLKPRDMARIGYLLLKKGAWQGKQIIPESWLRDSTKAYIKSDFAPYHYGYQWYIDKGSPVFNYSSQGLGGQAIFVIPDRDMVVVFTGAIRREKDSPPFYFMDFLLPAAAASSPLPANPEANRELARILREIENPRAQPVPDLPARARDISGRTFFFDTKGGKKNLFGLETATLFFDHEGKCRIRFTYAEKMDYISMGFDALYRRNPGSKRMTELDIQVGLDGIYRAVTADSEIGPMPYFAKGAWKDNNTFFMNYKSGWCIRGRYTFTFDSSDNLSVTCSSIFYKFTLTGRMHNTPGK